jgi:hypothetical protein
LNPDQLRRFIQACKDGKPEVRLERGVAQRAQETLHITGGENEIKAILGAMVEEDFTAADWSNRIYERKKHLTPLENYVFDYLGAKVFLSFYCLKARDAEGKVRLLEGFGIKSFHADE